MLTLRDWVTSSGKYPDRANSPELTDSVKSDAEMLINLVNQLLIELNVDISKVRVSSGFRPSNVNASIPNAAKKSLHMTGKAIDLEDKDNSLDELIAKNHDSLDKYGLWLESPAATPGWTHLDIGKRNERKVRIFLP